ncbi:hypothetical protein [uncultured Cetobacterium sp.]|uniref:hypothetical protein n=1 Tax=uncultured Cetobacterium sp. TaxID=527638 RepID=UPI002624AB46|nr:hypothetical protein [uncultured Cetobacterium sp.]
MKIGIVGPSDSVLHINQKLKDMDHTINSKFYIHEDTKNLHKILEECEKEVDALIFTGIIIEYTITKYRLPKIPFVTISRKGSSLMSALWQAQNTLKNINSFSIDILNQDDLSEVVDDWNLNHQNIHLFTFDPLLEEEDYAIKHKALFDSGKIDIILTSCGKVYSSLKAQGYPIFRLQPNLAQIKNLYRELLDKKNICRLKSSQIAIQIIKIDYLYHNNYYDDLENENNIRKNIISYVREVQGALYSSSIEQFIIFGTRGAFAQSLDNFSKLTSNLNMKIYSGIGYGSTAYLADFNARKALSNSLKNGKLYIIDDTNTLINPSIEKTSQNLNTKIEKISNTTLISQIHIRKILELKEKKKTPYINTKEIAGYLDISERSARRIINKLIDHNYGIPEIQNNISKGRPIKHIKISI